MQFRITPDRSGQDSNIIESEPATVVDAATFEGAHQLLNVRCCPRCETAAGRIFAIVCARGSATMPADGRAEVRAAPDGVQRKAFTPA